MDTEESRSGWTSGRVVGLILSLVGMVGFGGCSLFYAGVLTSLYGSESSFLSRLFRLLTREGFISALILGGLVLSFVCFLGARAVLRGARKQLRK